MGRFAGFGRIVMVLISSVALLPALGPVAVRASACNYVELHPGYPGYQGYVTGLDGVGDFACEEDLEREDSSFSMRREDRANRDAARELGIDGSEEDWTWENWMSIELERGLPATCYVCDFANADQRREPRDTSISSNDPRLLAGTPGGHSATLWFTSQTGISNTGVAFEDYQLRALVDLMYGNPQLNAPEMLQGYVDFLTGFTTGSGGAGMPDVHSLWQTLVRQGGYFPVPANATPDDQVAIITIGAYGLAPFLDQMSANALVSWIEQASRDWQVTTMDRDYDGQSFSDYLISIGALGWA